MKKWIVVLLLIYFMITELSAQESSKPTLFLLPGLACPEEIYTPLLKELLPGHACQVIDWTQASQKIGTHESIEQYVISLIRDRMENAGVSKAILFGHSMGGWLALSVAAHCPEQIDKLILIDAVPFPAGLYLDQSPESALAQGRQLILTLGQLDDTQYRAFNSQRIALMIEDPDNRNRLAEWFSAMPRSHMIRLMGEMASSDLRPLLDRILARTLVLASGKMAARMGLNRQNFAERLQLQFSRLTDFSLQITEQAGHFIMLDAPEWMNEKVKNFLEMQ